MATELLVDARIEEGKRLIADLAARGIPVSVAFWVQPDEYSDWFLYLAIPGLESLVWAGTFKQVQSSWNALRIPTFGLSQIKLIHPSDPMALRAAEARDRFGARLPVRLEKDRLGNQLVHEGYIYPHSPSAMTPEEVVSTVLRLLQRTGPVAPSQVVFRDGTTQSAVPVRATVGQQGAAQIALLNTATSVETTYPADAIVAIH